MAGVSFWLLTATAAAAAAAADAAWTAPCWDCGPSTVPDLLAVSRARAFLAQINKMTPSSGISLRATGFPAHTAWGWPKGR